MRTWIAFILPFVALRALSDVDSELWAMQTCIPQQVRLCDVAGVGTVAGSSESHIDIAVTQYWLGDPGSNTLHVVTDGGPMPIASVHSNIVFFATTNMHYQADTEDAEHPYIDPGISPFVWEYPFSRTNALQSVPLSFLGGGRGWLYADADGGDMLSLASNLVVHCRLSPNVEDYYSLIRLDAQVQSPHAQTKWEKFHALWAAVSYAGTNLVSLVANDTGVHPVFQGNAVWRIQNDMKALTDRTSP